MTENELFELVRTKLLEMIPANGGPTNLQVVRDYQVSQQGRTDAPTLYLARQDLHEHGSPRDSYEDDPDHPGTLRRINSQVIELKMQIQARLTYKPEKGRRVGDLLNLASRIMGTPAWREALRIEGVQTYRMQDNGLTYNTNDRDQYEAVPVLMATFIYTDTLVTTTPTVTTIRPRIERV